MLRLTKLTDYGVALMVNMAEGSPDNKVTAQGLSEDMRLPLPTVRKILKTLTRARLLESHRGIAGGYSLALKPLDISLMDIITALEGPMSLTECASSNNGSNGRTCGCERGSICSMQDSWNWINGEMEKFLTGLTLHQMAVSIPLNEQKTKPNLKDLQRLSIIKDGS